MCIMGWSKGSELMGVIIRSIKNEIPDKWRGLVYKKIIAAFEDADADTLDECLGIDPIYDFTYKEMNRELFEDDGDII